MFAPKSYTGLAASALSFPSLVVIEIQYSRSLGHCGYTSSKTLKTSIYLLS